MHKDNDFSSMTDNFRQRIKRAVDDSDNKLQKPSKTSKDETKLKSAVRPPSPFVFDEAIAQSAIDLSAMLLTVSLRHTGFNEKTQEILTEITKVLGFELSGLYTIEENKGLHLYWKSGVLSSEGEISYLPDNVRSGDGFIGSLWANRSPIFVGDLGGGSGEIRSFVGLPVFDGLELAGVLVFLSIKPRRFSKLYQAVLRNTATMLEICLFTSTSTDDSEYVFHHSSSLTEFNEKLVAFYTKRNWLKFAATCLNIDDGKISSIMSFYNTPGFKKSFKPVFEKLLEDENSVIKGNAQSDDKPSETRILGGKFIEGMSLIRLPLVLAEHEFGFLLIGGDEGFEKQEIIRELKRLSNEISGILFHLLKVKKLDSKLERIESNNLEMIKAERLRALGEMSSGVAHDFNNILAAIMGKTEMLKEYTKDPKFRKGLDFIDMAAMDGAQIIKRIQDFARYQPSTKREELKLNRIITETISLTEHRWKSGSSESGRNIVINTNLKEIPSISGRSSELKEVFTNLILNSFDAMPTGGVISISTTRIDNRVVVIYSDTGLGMLKEVKDRIFEPFFTTKGPKGSGLGMSVVYGIIQNHKGEITVDSKQNDGATFTISLPAIINGKDIINTPNNVTKENRILVVLSDQNESGRIKDLLFRSGYHAIGADSRNPADLVKNLRFNGAIVDYEVVAANCELFNEMLQSGKAHLIVQGPEDKKDEVKECMSSSVEYDYLSTPFRNYQVLLLIESFLS
ncbi:MAG: GAF domain-containing protein [candidate division Zixibacteria bacterium]|nr:GAF domain-containing protein [candidate division Zixibacteria bacterium]